MRQKWMKRAIWGIVLVLALSGAAWLAWPRPIAVDLGTVVQGPMEVTVDDEGKTRVRHIYTVSAPVAGKVLRISHPPSEYGISRHVGDLVTADDSVVAIMQPMTPGFVDVRSRQELEAAVAAADAAISQAEADIRKLQAAVDFSRTELQRAQSLSRTQSISAQALDKAKFDVETNEAALVSAKAQLEVRRFARASLAARMIDPSNASARTDPACCIQLRAPVTGRILKIVQDSEAVVQPGTPLIEIGDPADLEIVADLLSTDAVRVQVGAPVRIDGWGGSTIQGQVTRVDPAGFLKISALGIEEQRVRTTIDLSEPYERWSRLGHDYRVIVHITEWSAGGALVLPVAALFRHDESWAVYAVRDGHARTTKVSIGHRNNRSAEVLSGLSASDKVILHPSDRIREGAAVTERETR